MSQIDDTMFYYIKKKKKNNKYYSTISLDLLSNNSFNTITSLLIRGKFDVNIRLPHGLRELVFQFNDVTEIPNNLPDRLEKLICSFNRINRLPDKLPSNLQYLDCSFNKLFQLPKNLPTGLKHLYCNNNRIFILPKLPSKLTNLNTYENLIDPFPNNLPNSIVNLNTHNVILNNLGINNIYKNKSNTYLDYNFHRSRKLYDIKISHLPSNLPLNLENINCIYKDYKSSSVFHNSLYFYKYIISPDFKYNNSLINCIWNYFSISNPNDNEIPYLLYSQSEIDKLNNEFNNKILEEMIYLISFGYSFGNGLEDALVDKFGIKCVQCPAKRIPTHLYFYTNTYIPTKIVKAFKCFRCMPKE